MTKPANAAEKRHINRIAQMGCLVCGGEAEIHHVTSTGFHRITRTHRLVSPLCPGHHRYAPDAVHQLGHREFCVVHGIDLYHFACAEWDKSVTAEKKIETISVKVTG